MADRSSEQEPAPESHGLEESSPSPPSDTHPARAVFVTVGSTRFDALITALFSGSFIAQLRAVGVRSLVVQHGASPVDPEAASLCDRHGIALETFAYEPAIGQRMRAADIIVSHAGAGSLLEALALGKRVVAVANRALMDDHQQELAQALHGANCLVSTPVDAAAAAVARAALTAFAPFAARNRGVLPGVLAQELVML